MTVIRLGGFRGELPRIHPRLIPDGAAQTALNCRMDSGALESMRGTLNVQPTVLTSPISLHRYADTKWLESTNDVDWLPYPVANDTYGRLIYSDPQAVPAGIRVTDSDLVGTGGAVLNYYNLAVPPPNQGFSATVVGTADSEDEVPETRYYVCTFVNSWGAEGPPSPASNQVEVRTGQTVLLEGLPSVPTGKYNMVYRRIYRLNTGSSGATVYQFVTEIAVTSAQRVITGITQDNPVVVTTATAHALSEGQEVQFAGLGTDTAKVITGIDKVNPVRVYVASHGYTTGEYVALSSIVSSDNSFDVLNGTRTQITRINDGTFDLVGVDGTAYTGLFVSGTAAQAFGMDELNGNKYFVSVLDTDEFSLTGIDGTAYTAYLDEGLVGQVTGVTYSDAVPSAALAEVIPSELYDPPNSATIGLRSHPAGFLVGFFGNTLVFSEPGAPHAFPIDYRLVTNHDIVGLGVFGNTIAIVTEGWPYLAIGSDPSAITMIELEIEQACVAKRGIVDFGTAIAYPSPDGLIVINSNGATNATAAVFNRDQWQALVPTSFVAMNWEQNYLCFYDDGSTQRAFIINPFEPDMGVKYVALHATGGYKDIEEDLLYLIIDDEIEKWNESTTNLSYTWKSRPVFTPHAVNMAAAKVTADSYPVRVEFYVDDVKRFTKVVPNLEAFRLPGGFKGEKFEAIIKGTRRVSEFAMATTMRELAQVV